MKMNPLFVLILAMCLITSIFAGCTANDPQNSAVTADGNFYLLKKLEQNNEKGVVLSRTTYTYDDRGLVLTSDVDHPESKAVWDGEQGVYVYEYGPCDGMVDEHLEVTYDEKGNPTHINDGMSVETSYKFTYDENGRPTSCVETKVLENGDSYIDHTFEYDAFGNVKIWCDPRSTDTDPKVRTEFVYDENGTLSQMMRHLTEGTMTYRFQYDKSGRVVDVDYGWGDMIGSVSTVTYDEAGRVLRENGIRGEMSYQYKDGMLASINGESLTMDKQTNGELIVHYGDFVLTYTPAELDEDQWALARNRWNQFCGGFIIPHKYVNGTFGVRYPIFDLDTVLLLPKGIY